MPHTTKIWRLLQIYIFSFVTLHDRFWLLSSFSRLFRWYSNSVQYKKVLINGCFIYFIFATLTWGKLSFVDLTHDVVSKWLRKCETRRWWNSFHFHLQVWMKWSHNGAKYWKLHLCVACDLIVSNAMIRWLYEMDQIFFNVIIYSIEHHWLLHRIIAVIVNFIM